MNKFDRNPNVIKWSSESVKIVYVNPLTQKTTLYYPDFLVTYIDKNNNKTTKLIEVKPQKETYFKFAKSKRDKLRVAVNIAKWKAAKKWCDDRNIEFVILNENHIFGRI